MATCDHCGDAVKWVIGNAETGEQEYACDHHRGGTAPAPSTAAAPDDPNAGIPETTTCEICGLEPLHIIWEQPDHSARLYLGVLCEATMARVNFVMSDADFQERVSAAAEGQIRALRGGKKGRRRTAKPVAVHDADSDGEAVEAPPAAAIAGNGFRDDAGDVAPPDAED